MTGRFLRDNAFLVAAASLPVIVVGVFLLSTAIPRWTVAPPEYDLLLHTTDYDRPGSTVSVELSVRDGAVHATIRPALKDTHAPRVRLWRFDHTSLRAIEIPLDLPTHIPDGDPPKAIVVDGLRGRRIATDTKAPDGYELRQTDHRGPGLIGDLFGMRRYDQSVAIANRGRVVPIEIPAPNVYQRPVFLGWVIDEGAR
jgi:hypothetical protein